VSETCQEPQEACPKENNYEDLAKKIESMFQNPDFLKKISNNARKIIQEKFSLGKMILNYQKIYEDLFHLKQRRCLVSHD
jgi:glycosyltransferase involved in cell wall biosynthesis